MKTQSNQSKELTFQEKLKQILNNSNFTNFYSFQQKQNKWKILNPNLGENNEQFINFYQNNTCKQCKQIKAVTLNVLFDYRNNKQVDKDRGHMKFSKDRYQFIFQQLQKMKPDVISLNQVTKQFVKLLQDEHWVRKQYYLSITHNSNNFDFCFGNILLTKLKPLALKIHKVSQLPRPIMIGFFALSAKQNKKIVTFSSMHLIAYQEKWEIRRQQLKNISKCLFQHKHLVNQHILMGDMNFHSQKQNETYLENNLKDCWLQLYELEKNPGYTFDSQKNSFIKELYWGFEKRRMRLDRMFFTIFQEPTLIPIQMKVCFNQPIHKHEVEEGFMFIGKSALSYIGDMFSKNWFRNKQDYLFPSDHFGLYAIFAYKN